METPVETKSEIIYEEAPAEVKVETPVFDEAKYLSENFGFDKDTVKQKIADFEKAQTELAETKVKLAEPKFKNKASELFDEILSKSGGDLKSNSEFIKRSLDLLTTDEATFQPLELVKFDIKRQYPAMDDSQLNA